MARISLTDGSGRWFDDSKAEKFDEKTRWNGSNHISVATGSQWEHEVLYRTKGKQWIKYSYSQWQGSIETYEQIDDEEAAAWLVQNGHDHVDAAEAIAALEIE